jgi:hypothetical protein
MTGTGVIDYKTWGAAPTALLLLLNSPFAAPDTNFIKQMEQTRTELEYFKPDTLKYLASADAVLTSDQIFCQFAQKMIQNTEDINPDVHRILLENRENLLL